ncbi:MAG TPA: linear amide C-N hydrolase [Atribacter sp.]|jgi:penicillin V acylase-like amidase (Ntn superfamily)|uniref:linear amide C-N hydrolase n=1 Tax=Atribacter sp. TaxID=2847780 RepID=UPI002BAA606F|nr:linear amide C-N hydrolase [Atribacter sp.]HQK83124.1 linear amide C-N hydrolase [Atribacter sp.]
MKSKNRLLLLVIFFLMILLLANPSANACSRVLYHGLEGTVITGRTMDWTEDIGTNLWIFPREMEREGRVGPNSFKWTSKYGSVIATGYDISTTDGMNEEGLVANVLWLAESVYPKWDGQKPGLSLALWAQYVLDSFSTVEETVEALSREEFILVTADMPGLDKLATVHLAVSDSLGDSAIFEYVDGKLVIHHDSSCLVMTNSPTYQQQLALNEYWKEIGGMVVLPGTSRAADRFARAWFYINAIPKTADIQVAVASVFSVIRNVSVPFGISTPEKPNISSTLWRTVADHKNKIYFFESTLTPNIFWVQFNNIDFSPSAPARKLVISPKQFYAGDAADLFVETKPFEFMGLE